MIKADLSQWTVNIEKFVDKAKGKEKQFCVEFIQDLAEQVVNATPVVTGFLRNSWYASLNSDPSGEGGGGGIAALSLAANELKIGDVYHAANGAAYAMRVEFGFEGTDRLGRSYHQPPRAFVRGTLDRAESIANETATRVAAE